MDFYDPESPTQDVDSPALSPKPAKGEAEVDEVSTPVSSEMGEPTSWRKSTEDQEAPLAIAEVEGNVDRKSNTVIEQMEEDVDTTEQPKATDSPLPTLPHSVEKEETLQTVSNTQKAMGVPLKKEPHLNDSEDFTKDDYDFPSFDSKDIEPVMPSDQNLQNCATNISSIFLDKEAVKNTSSHPAKNTDIPSLMEIPFPEQAIPQLMNQRPGEILFDSASSTEGLPSVSPPAHIPLPPMPKLAQAESLEAEIPFQEEGISRSSKKKKKKKKKKSEADNPDAVPSGVDLLALLPPGHPHFQRLQEDSLKHVMEMHSEHQGFPGGPPLEPQYFGPGAPPHHGYKGALLPTPLHHFPPQVEAHYPGQQLPYFPGDPYQQNVLPGGHNHPSFPVAPEHPVPPGPYPGVLPGVNPQAYSGSIPPVQTQNVMVPDVPVPHFQPATAVAPPLPPSLPKPKKPNKKPALPSPSSIPLPSLPPPPEQPPLPQHPPPPPPKPVISNGLEADDTEKRSLPTDITAATDTAEKAEQSVEKAENVLKTESSISPAAPEPPKAPKSKINMLIQSKMSKLNLQTDKGVLQHPAVSVGNVASTAGDVPKPKVLKFQIKTVKKLKVFEDDSDDEEEEQRSEKLPLKLDEDLEKVPAISSIMSPIMAAKRAAALVTKEIQSQVDISEDKPIDIPAIKKDKVVTFQDATSIKQTDKSQEVSNFSVSGDSTETHNSENFKNEPSFASAIGSEIVSEQVPPQGYREEKHGLQTISMSAEAVPCTEQLSSPSQTSGRERSPSPVERKRSPSPPRSRRRSISPDRRRRSPSPASGRRRSPSPNRRRSRSPSGRRQRSISPGDRRRRSPVGSRRRRSPSPSRSRRRSPRRSSPVRSRRKSPSPNRWRRSQSPAKSGRSHSPRRHSPSPTRTRRRSPSPVDSRQRSMSPARRRQMSNSPSRRQQRTLSPGREKSSSPVPNQPETQSHKIIRKRSKSPSPVKGTLPDVSESKQILPEDRRRLSVSPSNQKRSLSPSNDRRHSSGNSRQRDTSPERSRYRDDRSRYRRETDRSHYREDRYRQRDEGYRYDRRRSRDDHGRHDRHSSRDDDRRDNSRSRNYEGKPRSQTYTQQKQHFDETAHIVENKEDGQGFESSQSSQNLYSMPQQQVVPPFFPQNQNVPQGIDRTFQGLVPSNSHSSAPTPSISSIKPVIENVMAAMPTVVTYPHYTGHHVQNVPPPPSEIPVGLMQIPLPPPVSVASMQKPSSGPTAAPVASPSIPSGAAQQVFQSQGLASGNTLPTRILPEESLSSASPAGHPSVVLDLPVDVAPVTNPVPLHNLDCIPLPSVTSTTSSLVQPEGIEAVYEADAQLTPEVCPDAMTMPESIPLPPVLVKPCVTQKKEELEGKMPPPPPPPKKKTVTFSEQNDEYEIPPPPPIIEEEYSYNQASDEDDDIPPPPPPPPPKQLSNEEEDEDDIPPPPPPPPPPKEKAESDEVSDSLLPLSLPPLSEELSVEDVEPSTVWGKKHDIPAPPPPSSADPISSSHDEQVVSGSQDGLFWGKRLPHSAAQRPWSPVQNPEVQSSQGGYDIGEIDMDIDSDHDSYSAPEPQESGIDMDISSPEQESQGETLGPSLFQLPPPPPPPPQPTDPHMQEEPTSSVGKEAVGDISLPVDQPTMNQSQELGQPFRLSFRTLKQKLNVSNLWADDSSEVKKLSALPKITPPVVDIKTETKDQHEPENIVAGSGFQGSFHTVTHQPETDMSIQNSTAPLDTTDKGHENESEIKTTQDTLWNYSNDQQKWTPVSAITPHEETLENKSVPEDIIEEPKTREIIGAKGKKRKTRWSDAVEVDTDDSNSDAGTPQRRRSNRIKSIEEKNKQEKEEKDRRDREEWERKEREKKAMEQIRLAKLEKEKITKGNVDEENGEEKQSILSLIKQVSSTESRDVHIPLPGRNEPLDAVSALKAEEGTRKEEMMSPTVKPKSRWRWISEVENNEVSNMIPSSGSSQINTETSIQENIGLIPPPPPSSPPLQEVSSDVKQDPADGMAIDNTDASSVTSDSSFKVPVLKLERIENDPRFKDLDVSPGKGKRESSPEPIPPVFEKIMDNIYLSERKKSKASKEVRRMVCDCTTSKEDRMYGMVPCGEDCLNRMLMIECGSRCPCNDHCTNKRFQKFEYSNVGPFQTDWKGWGLRANDDLQRGQFVMEYVGEVLGYKQFKARTKQYAREGHAHHYFMALNADEIIDAAVKGNDSRFINHSCDPNCETQKWTVNGQLRVGFFTRQYIPKGTELTFDYQFEVYGQEAQKCYCGSANCRGVLGVQKKKTEAEKLALENKKKEKKRRKELFDDILLEEEIERMQEWRGLKNHKHVLELCRIMVRAENTTQKLALLQIMQDTKEPACFRLFLGYHGLSLLWSWMADIGEGSLELKKQILSVLKLLPITNKTILEDSKVLSVVQKWAVELKNQEEKAEASDSGVDKDADGESASEPPSRAETPLISSSVQLDSVRLAEQYKSDSDDALQKTPNKKRILQRLKEQDEINSGSDSELSESSRHSTLNTLDISVNSTVSTLDSSLATSRLSASLNTLQESYNSTLASSQVSEGLLSFHEVSEGMKVPQEEETKDSEENDKDQPMEGEGLFSQEEEKSQDTHKSDDIEQGDAVQDVAVPDNIPSEQDEVESENVESENIDKAMEEEKLNASAPSGENIVAADEELFLVDEAIETKKSLGPAEQQDSSSQDSVQADTTQEEEMEPSEIIAKQEEPSLADFASELLESWSNLKELFRIPKKQEVEERKKTERELDQRDRERYRDRRDSYDRDRDRGRDRDKRYDKDRDSDYYRERSRDRDYDRKRRYDESPDRDRTKRRRKTDDDDKPRKTLLPTPPKMSKEERRQLFEAQVRAQDEMTRQQEEALQQEAMQQALQYQYYDQYGMPVTVDANGIPYVQDPNIIPAAAPEMLGADPNQQYADPNQPAAFINSQYEQQTTPQGAQYIDPNRPVIPQYLEQVPMSAQPQYIDPSQPQVIYQPTQQAAQYQVQPQYIQTPSGYVQVAAGSPGRQYLPQQQPLYYVPAASHSGVVVQQPYGQSVVNQSVVNQPVVSTQAGIQQVPLQHPLHAQQQQAMQSVEPDIEEDTLPPPAPPPPKQKLPPNWKTAKDPEGKTYYYHTGTRQTQWDPPTWEGAEQGEMDLGTPTHDEPRLKAKKKTTTAAADTSSEVAKRCKEAFRGKMSQYIVTCLNPFRRPDCKLGKITNTDDFKHLARKLTHHIMTKELKHCKHPEDLEVNENVKSKAKDYIKKYMSKFGQIYKRDPASPTIK